MVPRDPLWGAAFALHALAAAFAANPTTGFGSVMFQRNSTTAARERLSPIPGVLAYSPAARLCRYRGNAGRDHVFSLSPPVS
ncbi:hypothetical protein, partial [Methylogaea oryzae]|uniref:hypothetical protein n=1 Tax=Methylogaea oryzae TaxID=1295382 RepID=UPI001C3F19FB